MKHDILFKKWAEELKKWYSSEDFELLKTEPAKQRACQYNCTYKTELKREKWKN